MKYRVLIISVHNRLGHSAGYSHESSGGVAQSVVECDTEEEAGRVVVSAECGSSPTVGIYAYKLY